MNENEIGTIILDQCFKIHKEIGPGLFESVYEIILDHLLREKGLNVERQVSIPIKYQSIIFNEGFKADMIVEKKVVLELKSVEKISDIHKKQLNTYLRLTGCKLGYILNFNETLMKDGIVRVVNGLED